MPEGDLDEGTPLQSFAEDARGMEAAAFVAKHGKSFLVHEGPLHAARRPVRPQPTMVLDKTLPEHSSLQRPTPAPIQLRQLLVFAIRSTGRSPYPSMVTVGRTRNNDIVIADVAISKFHAFFKEEGGQTVLQDAGSRNGTRVDGQPVPDARHGKPVVLKSGARIAFGEIEFGFVVGTQLQELASLAPRSKP